MKLHKVDIDQLYMEEQRGTLALPIQIEVAGQWKLAIRVWVATRLIMAAAWLLNMGIEVDASQGPDA